MKSISYPASGTSCASARSRVPRKLTSAPSARSASATAIAGTTWPAVPPAAITTRGMPALHRAQVRRSAGGDVEQQPHRTQQHDQRRRSRRDERERDAGERREAEDGVDVEQRLAQDEAGESAREQLRVGALGLAGGLQPGVPDHAVQAQEDADPRHPELLSDDGEDEV